MTPFGAHTTPMPDDSDLSLPALAIMIAELLTELDLRHVTVVCNDWGGAQLLINPGGTDRVANLVLVSCEAFDNYPPEVPGRLLCLHAALSGGTFLTAQLLRPRWIHHLPVTFGARHPKSRPQPTWSAGRPNDPKEPCRLRQEPKPSHLMAIESNHPSRGLSSRHGQLQAKRAGGGNGWRRRGRRT